MAEQTNQHLAIVNRLPIGVELSGDLREPLDAAGQHWLHQLLADEGLLVFRKQQLSHPEQIRILGYCGTVLNRLDGVGYISKDTKKGGFGTIELSYHSDQAYTSDPYDAISLHAVDVVDGGTSTRFASGTKACATLPAALKETLTGVKVLSAMAIDMSGKQLDEEVLAGMPQFIRPAIIPHPVTGVPILYVNEQHAVQVENWPRAQSTALLRQVLDHLYRPEHLYEHYWYNGDLVIWDNLSLQHARGAQTGSGARTLQRVVCAPKSLFELCPQLSLGDPDYLQWVNSPDPVANRYLLERLLARWTRAPKT
jgi:taurine dioxygenase